MAGFGESPVEESFGRNGKMVRWVRGVLAAGSLHVLVALLPLCAWPGTDRRDPLQSNVRIRQLGARAHKGCHLWAPARAYHTWWCRWEELRLSTSSALRTGALVCFKTGQEAGMH